MERNFILSINDIKEKLLSNPFNRDFRSQLAEEFEKLLDWNSAIQQWEILAGQDPKSVYYILKQVHCLIEVKKIDQASFLFEEARGMEGFVDDKNLSSQLKKPVGNIFRLIDEKNSALEKKIDTVKFSDIIGMEDLKKQLRLKIIDPFKNPSLFAKFRKNAGGGAFLYGPPGCGKTFIAKAVAFECQANFINVSISDVLSKWVGQSEANLAKLFDQARSDRPSVMFFDELDALAFSRSKSTQDHSRTLINEFLAQLDGVNGKNEQVLFLAATNMPWDVDPAMKRPGRFSKPIFVGPPDLEARTAMLKMKLESVPKDNIDFNTLAKKANYFSGADLDALIDSAKEKAIEDTLSSGKERNLRMSDFDEAIVRTTSSIREWMDTAKNLVKYAGANTGDYGDLAAFLKNFKN